MRLEMQKHKDTETDKEIKECLKQKQSFSVIAGAGSGKTTSLITALDFLRKTKGAYFRRDDKKIACITYTNRAVDVISSRLEWDELFYVSTLHKFLWKEVGRFTSNIREVLRDEIIPNHIKKKKEKDNGGKSKTAIKAREKAVSLQDDLDKLDSVNSFSYNDIKYSNYAEGKLGHDDVIDIAAYLIVESEVLRLIIGQKYPYIFIDEAQDTFSNVVDAFNKLCENDGLPVIGYFGDPMQQIYEKRAGDFSGPPNSIVITKEENFRSAQKVIDLLNAFRQDVEQFPAGENVGVEGSVLIRLVKAETPEGPRKRYTKEQLERASIRFEEALKNWGWSDRKDVKYLFLAHQMIARRLNFLQLRKLFTGQFASEKAQNDYEKGEHFLLKPFVEVLFPLIQAHKNRETYQIINILRKESPAFDPVGGNAEKPLKEMLALSLDTVLELSEQWTNGTLGDILKFGKKHNLYDVSVRLDEHLNRSPRTDEYDSNLHSNDKAEWLADVFFSMPTSEIEPFISFINENTPFSTQHGVKGEEYKDVLVVFDDVEPAWNNYSFTKMLAPNTSGNPTEGQYERSKKLAYVCFSRAEENLRILLFTLDPENVKKELVSNKLFDENQISVVN